MWVKPEVALTNTDEQHGNLPSSSVSLKHECRVLLTLPPLQAVSIQQLSPSALAYLGDAVYELYMRHFYLIPPKRLQTYHSQVVAQVRAERQAEHLRALLPLLTDSERELVKRGRNAAIVRPRRVDPDTYQQATSLETLIGYLYLTNPQRLTELLTQLELPPPPSA